ncbi:hypothetical protein Bca101_026619 [Brassica carinata]
MPWKTEIAVPAVLLSSRPDFSVRVHPVFVAKERTFDLGGLVGTPVMRRKGFKRLLSLSREEGMFSLGRKYI